MFNPPATFSPVEGHLLGHWRSALASWAPISVTRKRPPTMPKRLLTLRDDSGPHRQGTALLDQGVNVWADDPVDAKSICFDAIAALRDISGVGNLVTTSDVVGPREVDDEPAFTYQGMPLHHYYFSFAVLVRAS